jgi:hypothetical protein
METVGAGKRRSASDLIDAIVRETDLKIVVAARLLEWWPETTWSDPHRTSLSPALAFTQGYAGLLAETPDALSIGCGDSCREGRQGSQQFPIRGGASINQGPAACS